MKWNQDHSKAQYRDRILLLRLLSNLVFICSYKKVAESCKNSGVPKPVILIQEIFSFGIKMKVNFNRLY